MPLRCVTMHERPDEAADAGPPALRLPFDVAELDHRPIRTDRMVLRPLRESDADDVWQYQRLPEVLHFHRESVKVLHILTPIGVAMAGADEFDPYKD